MNLKDKKLCIIGGGNLGVALARGIANKQLIKPEDIIITRRKIEQLDVLREEGFTVTSDNASAVEKSEILIIAVQPKQLSGVFDQIRGSVRPSHMIISTLAGTAIALIQEQLKKEAIVLRAMPNTASAVGESITCLAGDLAHTKELVVAEAVFQSIGDTLVIEENLMKAATVLGASGIAFFMRYLRAATQGGIQMGFHPEEAQRIAVQTAKGAAMLIQQHQSHPELEIDKVTTPQGCTIAGLNEMEHEGFSSALIKGLMISYHKLDNIRS
jgi:pyrroline-5-carboxylate reductase